MKLSLVDLNGELLVVTEASEVVENVEEVRLRWPDGRCEATATIKLDRDEEAAKTREMRVVEVRGRRSGKTDALRRVSAAQPLPADEEVHEHEVPTQRLAPEFQGDARYGGSE